MKQQRTIYIDIAVWEELDAVAKREGRKRQDLISTLLRSYVSENSTAEYEDSLHEIYNDLDHCRLRLRRLLQADAVGQGVQL